jgi:predicted kinase
MAVPPSSPTLYILCGLPFAGKTSLGRAIAAHTGAVIVTFDDLYDAHGEELARTRDSLAVWQAVRDLAGEQIAELLRRGIAVVYDNTNFRAAHRAALRAIAEEAGAQATIVHVDTPLAVIAARRAANARTQGRGDIMDTDLSYVLSQWEAPLPGEGVIEFRPDSDLLSWLADLDSRANPDRRH